MKRPLIYIFIFSALHINAQKVSILNEYKIDSNSVLMGLNQEINDENSSEEFHFSAIQDNQEYIRFNFIVTNLSEIEKLKSFFVFKKQTQKKVEPNGFGIYLLNNKSIQKFWIVNPQFNNILTGNGCYFFDTTMLLNIAQNKPLNYRLQMLTFSSVSEFDNFKIKIKQDPKLIFLTEPDKKYEGQFTVTVKRTNWINSGQKAIDFVEMTLLKGKLLKNANKDKYKIGYDLKTDDTDRSIMTLTIKCSKIIYDKFYDSQIQKGEWRPILLNSTLIWLD